VKDARTVAYDLLRAVDERDAYANLLLPTLVKGLDQRDRALAAELGYGTLRALGTLDHVLGLCSSRPVAEIDPPVRDVLRLGAYQLLKTRVATHAAVSTSVDLARRVAGPGPAKFVNAVLRRVAERDGDLGLPGDPLDALAIETYHPRWIVEAFRDALGGDLAETRQALLADDLRPEVHLVARPGRIARDGLVASCRAAGLEADPGTLSPYAVRLHGGDPGDVPAVRDGSAGVQDEGSQYAALALTRALGEQGPHTLLDLCAGPGGKAALLAGTLHGRLVAAELHPHRTRLVRDNVTAARGIPTAYVTADGRRGPWRDGTFDGVLVDAPCTGLGALRRRPEARWRRQPEDVAPLAQLQRELLAAAVAAARPGGYVVYVVCSPHPAETEAVVGAQEGVAVVDTEQLWPHRNGTDAMFVSTLRKAGS
jgi:16S rRNA (cytosine967-C5)-methyltransferase